MTEPLTLAELDAKLDEYLDPVLSSRRTAGPLARALAPLERGRQEFALKWVDIIAKTNAELAYQFGANAPQALALMAEEDVEAWIIRAMDVYDKKGLYPACTVFKDVEGFHAEVRDKAYGVTFEEVSHVLELFVRGLSGRPLKIEAADEVYTDTATLFLPQRVARFPDREANFRLYKAMAAHQWAQTRFGTFRVSLLERTRDFPDPARAQRVFHALETLRLDACLRAELGGLARELAELRALAGDPAPPAAWSAFVARLACAGADAQDTYDCLREAYAGPLPTPACYQGELRPEQVEQTMAARQALEKEQFRTALARLQDEKDRAARKEAAQTPEARERFALDARTDPEQPDRVTYELTLDGEPVAPPPDVRALMDSIIQDLGEIPPDYLAAAGTGGYRKDGAEKDPADAWKGTYHEEGAFLYNEWDFRRRHYRKDWCVLRELNVHPSDEPFVIATLRKYAGLATSLRKTFEALRGENKLLKKQKYGDEVDIDALIEAHADVRTGKEMTERLFLKSQRIERNIAVMFMVDMSGSTKGWINDAERESLVLLCEALEVLGDRYAIYGFSGMTRKRCELYRVKRFDEPYTDDVRRRIAGIKPQDYTRMGVAIRHLSRLLNEVEARTKLLITLSDGKPDDYDGYRGDYGIEDTRQALFEARRAGIHPFCVTIDSEARDYLPHMYGAANYAVIDDVRKLPLKVSDIYRRLTA